MATSNDTANVSVGKGVKGGYFYSADLGVDLPQDYSSELAEEWTVLGYISEDGVTEATDEDTTDILDMNGDTILSESSSYTKTFALILHEIKKAALSEYFGTSTVEDNAGMIVVAEESGAREQRSYVFELALSGNRRERIVIPCGKVTEVGEITYAAGEAIGYEITITCFPDADGHQTYRYIQSTETTGEYAA